MTAAMITAKGRTCFQGHSLVPDNVQFPEGCWPEAPTVPGHGDPVGHQSAHNTAAGVPQSNRDCPRQNPILLIVILQMLSHQHIHVVLVTQSCLTLCKPTRFLCPRNSLGKTPGVGSYSLLQEIFPGVFSDQSRVSCIAGRFFTI